MLNISISLETVFIETNELVPDWRRGDIDKLQNFFKETDWKLILSDKNTHECWDKFSEIVNEGMSKHIPSNLRRNKNRPKWINRSVIKLSRKKN